MNKIDWQYQTHIRARHLFEELNNMLESAPTQEDKERFLSDPDNYYLQKLNKIYTDDFQLAALKDKSDIVFHAEGDAAQHDATEISAISWLTQKAQRNFKRISKSYLAKHLHEKYIAQASKQINFTFNGYAPGSIYLGFSITPADISNTLFDEESPAIESIREIITSLTEIPSFIIDGKVDKLAMLEIVPDPAMRDTVLSVSHDLSPSGKSGIDELAISNNNNGSGTFTQVTKRQFKDAINNPLSKNRKRGSFFGEIREVDLDKQRFDLRGVRGIGNIRCIKPKHIQGSSILGEYVKVTGDYETDKDGNPSLMLVETIEIKTPIQEKF